MKLRELFIFESLERTGEGQLAVVGWGRGMGHKGHMMLASSVITHAKELNGDPYFVVSRTYGPDDPIEPEEKLAIYRKVFPEKGHIFQTASDELPDLTRVLGNLNNQGYTDAIVVVGADQKAAFQYLNHYNGKPDKKGNVAFNFNSLQVISRQETNDPSKDQEGPRATPMRQVLQDPAKTDDEQFAQWRADMSPELDDEEVRDLMSKAKTRMAQMAAEKAKGKKKSKEHVAQEDAAGVGTITKQNSTCDVNANTPKKNLRAFRLAEQMDAIEQELAEAKGGMKKITKDQKAAMKNASTLPALNQSTGSAYMNYRMGIALAGAPNFPAGGEADNWIGGDPLLSTYTDEEFEMVKAAAKQVGAGTIQNWSGNRSKEVADVNKTSTVAKVKRNKYGV